MNDERLGKIILRINEICRLQSTCVGLMMPRVIIRKTEAEVRKGNRDKRWNWHGGGLDLEAV